MSEGSPLRRDEIERRPLGQFARQAYLDYSMYVILDRALPHIGDGLKPVQRRILFAMSELGLPATAKHKKSARTVGDVLGKYHPHGDSACYEAMILMAQPFSYRYPLIDGQGNWGSQDDPKSFAAMRYTEARLTRYAKVLLSELGQGTVEWVPNFDGSTQEPKIFPAQVPNILLNGTTGIAVGMTTDIPPHNLRELVAACLLLLERPHCSLSELCEQIPGPDYPSRAELITPAEEIREIYRKGIGSVRTRAVYEQEEDNIVITALPYQVSGTRIQQQIGTQITNKKLPMLEDLRDESDHENPTRLVLMPRSHRVDIPKLMSHLFATTDLERSYRVNLNIIGLNGCPRVMDLHGLLSEWLTFRKNTVRKRLEYHLQQIRTRLHELAGLLIAFLNMDEVIKIIREEEQPKPVLMQRFALAELQTESILNLRLRHLARLEEIKIRSEQKKCSKEQNRLEKILGSEQKLTTLIRKELIAVAEEFGDDRRSPLVVREMAEAIDQASLVPSEAMTVVISKKGWVRAAKGHEVDAASLSYKTGDSFLSSAHTRSNKAVFFLDSSGRSYSQLVHSLPSARGQGEPLTGRLTLPSGATIVDVLSEETEEALLLASDAGYGFVFTKTLHTKNKAGKVLLSVPKGAFALPACPIESLSDSVVVAVSSEGRMLSFPVTELPCLSRGKGNKIIQIAADRVASRTEFMLAIKVLGLDTTLVIHAGKRHLTLQRKDLKAFQGSRGQLGHKLPRGFQRVDLLQIK